MPSIPRSARTCFNMASAMGLRIKLPKQTNRKDLAFPSGTSLTARPFRASIPNALRTRRVA